MTAPTALPDYGTGDFFFSSPYGSVLAEGALVVSPQFVEGCWSDTAEAMLSSVGGDGPQLVVGALGFAADTHPRLVVPKVARWGRPPRWLTDVPPATAVGSWTVRARPLPAEFERGVARAVAAIEEGGLEKVVLARSLEMTGPAEVAVGVLLRRLADRNACGYVFAADVTAPADRLPRTLVGASPELLVSRRGRHVVSNPLAGSVARHPDPTADRARASALVGSEKDHREHAVVVGEVTRRLQPICVDLVVPAEPVLVRTPALWHLSTRVTGTLRDPRTTALMVAQALHPTPAVGGLPVDSAVRLIREIEGFDRGYYAGLVGWCDANGDGEWAIALRCAEAQGPDLRLFAGGGVVAGSVPAVELAETRAKFQTFLAAVGVEVDL